MYEEASPGHGIGDVRAERRTLEANGPAEAEVVRQSAPAPFDLVAGRSTQEPKRGRRPDSMDKGERLKEGIHALALCSISHVEELVRVARHNGRRTKLVDGDRVGKDDEFWGAFGDRRA